MLPASERSGAGFRFRRPPCLSSCLQKQHKFYSASPCPCAPFQDDIAFEDADRARQGNSERRADEWITDEIGLSCLPDTNGMCLHFVLSKILRCKKTKFPAGTATITACKLRSKPARQAVWWQLAAAVSQGRGVGHSVTWA